MLKNLEIVSRLGKCFKCIGVVLLARRGSHLVALKKLDLDEASTEDLAAVQRDLLITRQLSHPNILAIENVFVDKQNLYVSSPVAAYGSCADLVANHFPNGLSENALALILRDVLAGLAYLHGRRILHRALRGRHILITSNGRAQLSSLRHAESFTPGDTIHIFSEDDIENLYWLSPEVLAQDAEGYNEKSDVYSVAMTCFELINGLPPFSDVCPTIMLVEKLRGCIPTFSREVTAALDQVIAVCSLNNPDLRPSAQQLLSLPFFKVKGDLPTLLNPVIPLTSNKVQADVDDLRAILASSHKMAEISIDNIDWNFD